MTPAGLVPRWYENWNVPSQEKPIAVKIVVCIKQVPARDSVLRLNSAATWVQETDLGFEVNEPDIYALEEGLRLKEKHGGEVVLATLGPARAQQAIKEALAKGADRALHLDDPAFATLDAFGIARALGKAIEKEKPDIILTGLQSDDFGAAQAGVVLAEFLACPTPPSSWRSRRRAARCA